MLVTPQIDAAVGSHLHVSITSDFKVLCRQRKQIGLVHSQETFLSCIWVLQHALLVVRLHLLCCGLIKLVKREESHIPKLCIDSLIYQFYMVLHEAFVFRMHRPCRQNKASVVIGHILEYPVDRWLIAVALHDGSLKVVRDKYLRYASYVFKVL